MRRDPCQGAEIWGCPLWTGTVTVAAWSEREEQSPGWTLAGCGEAGQRGGLVWGLGQEDPGPSVSVRRPGQPARAHAGGSSLLILNI